MVLDTTPSSSRQGPGGEAAIAGAKQVGHFQVLRQVGEGGMGQVYAAYDPKLDRRVALKLLNVRDDERDDLRLVREAQALAKLAHPNVVSVHDVGAHGKQLFVAMEFVDGVTLRQWAKTHPPDDRKRQVEALDLLLQAGQGLRAAHAVGLVHRDFKPSNVLVGEDGRVRVVDFGLARAQPTPATRSRAAAERAAPDKVSAASHEIVGAAGLDLSGSGSVTQTGRLTGTPAYMAPERFLGEAADAASDQFAFCVTAWEVLLGVRPFAFEGPNPYLRQIRRGTLRRPPQLEVSPELEAALRKGLAFNPSRRHASMEVILQRLSEIRDGLGGATAVRPRSRRIWAASLSLVAVASTVAFVAGRADSAACTGAQQQLSGTWDPQARARLEQAFGAVEAGFGADAWARFEQRLDTHAREWAAAHRDACEAAQVRKEQSTELMDLRMACLESRRVQLSALTEIYATPDLEMLARTEQALDGLDSIDRCADPQYVRNRGRQPTDPAEITQAAKLERTLATAAALLDTGRADEALHIANAAVADSASLGLIRLTAKAYLIRGATYQSIRQTEDARDDLEHAYLLAKDGGDDEVALGSARRLLMVSGTMRGQQEEGRWWERVAQAEVERSGDPLEAIRLLLDQGMFEAQASNQAKAIDYYERAVARLLELGDDESTTYARATRLLGGRLVNGGDFQRALPLLREAQALYERTLGPRHPVLINVLSSIGAVHRLAGKPQLARATIDEALTLATQTFGPNHVLLTNPLLQLVKLHDDPKQTDEAIALVQKVRALHVPAPQSDPVVITTLVIEAEFQAQRARSDEAESAYRQALALSIAALGPLHPKTGQLRVSLGSTLAALGRRTEAIGHIEAGLALGEDALGQAESLATVLDSVAHSFEEAGDLPTALEFVRRGITLAERTLGADDYRVAALHYNCCSILRKAGRTEEALVHCRRADELTKDQPGYQRERVYILNGTGSVLMEAGRLDEALALYQRARKAAIEHLEPGSLSLALITANIAEIHALRGRPNEALSLYTLSLEYREQRFDAAHPILAVPLLGMAHALIDLGRAERALPLAKRAMTLTDPPRGTPLEHARAQVAHARAETARPGRRRSTAALLAQARETFAQHPDQARLDLERLEAWGL